MTDEQIIKALECCTSTTEIGCELCPYSNTVNCLLRSTQDALDLINRQKAEIVDEREKKEMLAAVIARQDEERAVIVADRDNLLKENNRLQNHFRDLTKMIRAEAIKEFAERLKRKSRRISEYDEGGWCMDIRAVKVEDIDNLVKEMTEGQP